MIFFLKNTYQIIVKKNGWKWCHLNLDKLNYHDFTHYVILRCEKEGKSYITYYDTKLNDVIMKMFHTAEVDIPEDFRDE